MPRTEMALVPAERLERICDDNLVMRLALARIAGVPACTEVSNEWLAEQATINHQAFRAAYAPHALRAG